MSRVATLSVRSLQQLTLRIFLRIQNPLHGIPREQLEHTVNAWSVEHGLEEHQEMFRRGALVAQNPSDFETMDLTEDEKLWMRKEKTSAYEVRPFSHHS